MALSSIIGQAYAKERLGTLFSGEPGHAYVLTGPSGIGKTMLAREVGKGLLCSNPTKDGACGICPCCRYFDEGTHPDFRELSLGSGEKTIRVADVRSRIGADVNIYPQISSRKVYLIDGDGLNEEGQNALLKTLEEPPPSVVFILTVADAGKLLKTIVSRAVMISMPPNSEKEILTILHQKTKLDESEALFYARYSNGIPGQALSLAQSQWFSSLREDAVDLLFSFALCGKSDVLTTALFYARYSNGIPGQALSLAQSQWFSSLREDAVDLLFSFALCGKSDVLTTGYSFFDTNKDHVPEILLILQLVFRDMALLLRMPGGCSLLNEDKRDKMIHILSRNQLNVQNIESASHAATHAAQALSSNCSFESTVCQMLLSIQKEFTNAKSSIRPVS